MWEMGQWNKIRAGEVAGAIAKRGRGKLRVEIGSVVVRQWNKIGAGVVPHIEEG